MLGGDLIGWASEQFSAQSEYGLVKFEITMIDCGLDEETRAECLADFRRELDEEQVYVMAQVRAWLEAGASGSVTFERKPPPLN